MQRGNVQQLGGIALDERRQQRVLKTPLEAYRPEGLGHFGKTVQFMDLALAQLFLNDHRRHQRQRGGISQQHTNGGHVIDLGEHVHPHAALLASASKSVRRVLEGLGRMSCWCFSLSGTHKLGASRVETRLVGWVASLCECSFLRPPSCASQFERDVELVALEQHRQVFEARRLKAEPSVLALEEGGEKHAGSFASGW